MILPSIRWRIQVWHGGLLTLVTAGLLVSFWHYQKSVRLGAVEAELRESLVGALPVLTPGGRPPPGPPGARAGRRPPPGAVEEPRVADLEARLALSGQYFVVWREEGPAEWSALAPLDVPFPDFLPEPGQSGWRTRGPWREIVHAGQRGTVVLLGASAAGISAELRTLAWQLAGAGTGVVAVGLLVAWWLGGRALRPVRAISQAAARIAAGDLAQRIDTTETESELGQLAVALNHTFDRLEETFARQVRFTADASHELRTPLSVILTKCQLARSRERTPEEYREALATCERAARRMRELVHSLLELARLDAGGPAGKMLPGDLAAVAREVVDDLSALDPAHRVSFAPGTGPLPVCGDADQLYQVLTNLTANALQHTPPGTAVSVETAEDEGFAVVRVRDAGPGIAPEFLPRLFDRFFRADAARSGGGGSGLGLAIARAIVEAHGGSLTAESRAGEGTVFLVRMPLAAAGAACAE